jgi:hypothetical protein
MPATLRTRVRWAFAKNARAWLGRDASTGGEPATTVEARRPLPNGRRDTEVNCRPGPAYGAMKVRNFCGSPLVASANAAADASGVWIEGTAPARTSPSSRTREFNNRFSLCSYSDRDVHANANVTTSTNASTAAANYGALLRGNAPADIDAPPSSAAAFPPMNRPLLDAIVGI